jgi:hypothetical protein
MVGPGCGWGARTQEQSVMSNLLTILRLAGRIWLTP